VLVDTERLYFIATQHVLAGVGIPLSREQYIDHLLVKGKPPWYMIEGATPWDIEKLRNERNDLYGLLLAHEHNIIDGAGDVLEELSRRYTMGIVTNSRSDHFDIIHKRTGFLKYFQFAITSDLYTHTKPHPEPYLLVLEHSGLKAEECIVIEDSARGLAAANAAGIRCIVIPNEFTHGSNFTGVFKIMKSINELLVEL
jgi:HAD superfamily hydrolase (TIGR01509 family)